ncbi:hypothetical protein ACIPIN_08125 [Pseudomonas sp. NPDC087697]|uniref:hypothetical protein n=1 Tax=Pseudomonas sp. NPDC087697 TaxID=3364447 RepID=UPI003822C706
MPINIGVVQGVTRLGRVNNTTVRSFSTHREATESIRRSLGVKFSDYFALSKFTLFVEGETDKAYIEYVWSAMQPSQKNQYPYLNSNELLIKDFTGVTDLVGFLKSNFGLLHDEICVVSLFDGDKAGVDAVRGLASYCSNKNFNFNGNREYVLIPGGHPIEGLFPGEWIVDAYEHEPVWFEGSPPIIDADEKLVSFKIRDGSKKAFMKYVLERYDDDNTYDSSERFFSLFKAINRAFELQDTEGVDLF